MSAITYLERRPDPHYLDAAARDYGYVALLKINIIVCSLSLASSLVMIIPFVASKQLRKLRHRLILGMAVNDFLLAGSVLVPSAWSMHHGSLVNNSPGCQVDSFVYLTCVIAGCLWTLAIALTTYITLVQPLSKLANALHRTRSSVFLWVGISLISLINAAIGTPLSTSVDGGGYCFFATVAPYLYGNLVLFIPRTLTFLIIIVIYARLYVFFRGQAASKHLHESGEHFESGLNALMPTPLQYPAPAGSNGNIAQLVPIDKGAELGVSPPETTMQANALRKKLADYRMLSSYARADSLDSEATLSGTSRLPATDAEQIRYNLLDSSPGSLNALAEDQDSRVYQTARRPSALIDSSGILASPDGFGQQLDLFTRDHGQNDFVQTPGELQMHPRDSLDISVDPESVVEPPLETPQTVVHNPENVDQEKAQELKIIPTTSADDAIGLWEALAGRDPNNTADHHLGETETSGERRLSASEENRRVSYLMLLYPLAYSLVLAVSIARLAATLITGAPPNPVLQLLNRILILGTGIFDACIYTVIEWRFRKSSQNAADRDRQRTSRRASLKSIVSRI